MKTMLHTLAFAPAWPSRLHHPLLDFQEAPNSFIWFPCFSNTVVMEVRSRKRYSSVFGLISQIFVTLSYKGVWSNKVVLSCVKCGIQDRLYCVRFSMLYSLDHTGFFSEYTFWQNEFKVKGLSTMFHFERWLYAANEKYMMKFDVMKDSEQRPEQYEEADMAKMEIIRLLHDTTQPNGQYLCVNKLNHLERIGIF